MCTFLLWKKQCLLVTRSVWGSSRVRLTVMLFDLYEILDHLFTSYIHLMSLV